MQGKHKLELITVKTRRPVSGSGNSPRERWQELTDLAVALERSGIIQEIKGSKTPTFLPTSEFE